MLQHVKNSSFGGHLFSSLMECPKNCMLFAWSLFDIELHVIQFWKFFHTDFRKWSGAFYSYMHSDNLVRSNWIFKPFCSDNLVIKIKVLPSNHNQVRKVSDQAKSQLRCFTAKCQFQVTIAFVWCLANILGKKQNQMSWPYLAPMPL